MAWAPPRLHHLEVILDLSAHALAQPFDYKSEHSGRTNRPYNLPERRPKVSYSGLHLRNAYVLMTARAVDDKIGPVPAVMPVADQTKTTFVVGSSKPTTTQDVRQHTLYGKSEGAQKEKGAKSEKECKCTRLRGQGIQLWVLIGDT